MGDHISRHAAGYINKKTYKPEAVMTAAKAFLPDYAPADMKPRSLRHLALVTGIEVSVLSRIQNKKCAFTPYAVVALQELTGWTLDELKSIAGVQSFTRCL